jgi:magnesium chelatase accessory protein
MAGPLIWERDGHGWPHAEASRFVMAAGLRWHVQQMGPDASQGAVAPPPPHPSDRLHDPRAPWVLLIHGTGAATHSWRGLMPLLAAHFNVLAVDLPGHGFTGAAPARQLSLPGMAQALGVLLTALGVAPQLIVGHSAGAAIAARMCLDGHVAPAALVSLNGALLPLGGLPGLLFPPVAKLMAALPFVPRLFSRRAADAASVRRLIEGTGSTLDAAGAELYGRLLRNPGHAAGALGMMANWDLRPLERDLTRLQAQLSLVVGANDRAVPPEQALRVQAMLPHASLVTLAGLGHLAHEERPEQLAKLVLDAAARPARS